jgi:hypothetical protein
MSGRSALAVAVRFWARGGAGRILVSLLAAGALWLSLVPLHSGVAAAMMERFHLRGARARWVLLQALPSMYNFVNVVQVHVPGGDPEDDAIWLNHYPLRAITYTHRRQLAERPAQLRIETRFGAAGLVTTCHTTPQGGGIAVRCQDGT